MAILMPSGDSLPAHEHVQTYGTHIETNLSTPWHYLVNIYIYSHETRQSEPLFGSNPVHETPDGTCKEKPILIFLFSSLQIVG